MRTLASIIVALSSLLSPGAASALEPGAPATRLLVGLGPGHLQIRDELLRPFRWDGASGAMSFALEHEGSLGFHLVELRFPGALVRTRYGAGGAVYGSRLSYSWVFPVALLGGGRLSVGGDVTWDLALQYYFDWDEEHLYWLNTHGIGPALRYEREVGGSTVLSNLSMPIVALVSRPPAERFVKIEDLENLGYHLTAPHRGLRATSLHELFALRWQLGIARKVSESWSLRATYELGYRRFSEPRPIASIENSLLFSAGWES